MRGVKAASVYRRLSRFAACGYEEEEHHTERETRFIQLRAPESSGKDPTCCLWLGLIPLLT